MRCPSVCFEFRLCRSRKLRRLHREAYAALTTFCNKTIRSVEIGLCHCHHTFPEVIGTTGTCASSSTASSSCSTSHSCNTIDHHREFLSYTLFFSLLLQPMCLFELHNELRRTYISAKSFFHHFERDSLSGCHFMSIDGVFECSAALCRHGHFEPCYQMVLQRHHLPILRLFCCHVSVCIYCVLIVVALVGSSSRYLRPC